VAVDSAGNQLGYQTNNSEIMAILLDMEAFPMNGQNTVNYQHAKNPQRTKFLKANMVGDRISPGIGTDLVYRDPWGQPYIITVDLNNDERARDAFYRNKAVSYTGSSAGLNGLVDTVDANGSGNNFEFNGPVTVWSAGPDKMIDPATAANKGVNADNVVSWKQ
jgi:hypothetical protein